MSGTSDFPSAEQRVPSALHVLLWGTYDTSKPRIRILRKGLIEEGVHVDTIHADVWGGIEDKSQMRGLRSRLRVLARLLGSYPGLIRRLMTAPRPDVILVSYPGVIDAVIAHWIGRRRQIPVVFDVFISLYDTVVEDRALIRPGSMAARFLHALERKALRCADLAFMDTQAHARRIETLFAMPHGSCGHVWVGAESEVFDSGVRSPAPGTERMTVLFYGQYIPLHGLPVIVRAARQLRDLPIDWVLIGRGQETQRIERMLRDDPLPNVTCIPWVSYDELRHYLADAHLCLGIFGASAKAASVIPNKVFQIVAAGRPLVTRDSPAIRELFERSAMCARLVPADDAAALANEVRDYWASEQWKQEHLCHSELKERIGERAIARQWVSLIQDHVARGQDLS